MAQSTKGRLNYRCPSCFMRDLDIDMFYDSEKQEFYCIRCQFFGTEEQVLKMNEMVRVRYKDMMKRFFRITIHRRAAADAVSRCFS